MANFNNSIYKLVVLKKLLPLPLSATLEAVPLADSTPLDATSFTFSFASENMTTNRSWLTVRDTYYYYISKFNVPCPLSATLEPVSLADSTPLEATSLADSAVSEKLHFASSSHF